MKTYLLSLALLLCIAQTELVQNCRDLCASDGLRLVTIEHDWDGYDCRCSNNSVRAIHTAKTVWVEPVVENEETK